MVDEITTAVEAADQNAEFAKPRTKGQPISESIVHDPAYPWPALNPERVSPAAYAAVIDKKGDRGEETLFHLDPEKMKGLPFAPAGRPIPGKPLYTVKCVHADGRLGQLPFEEQINNTAAGDMADAIGLNRYARKVDEKGEVLIHLLVDLRTMIPVYCPAWDCWAKAGPSAFGHFCCEDHARKTLPNVFKGKKAQQFQGLIAGGVTTSRVWGAG